MRNLTLVLLLLMQPWFAGCADPHTSARWADGALSASWTKGLPALSWRMGDAEPVQLNASRRERLGLSAFQSSGHAVALRSELSAPGWTATLLSVERQARDERPIAAILQPSQRRGGTVVIWCGAADTAALEHLYAFLLRSPVEISFEVKDVCGVLGQGADAVTRAHGADLLKRVAQLRAARPVAPQADGRRWDVAQILPRLDGNEPLQSEALVRGPGGPMAGVAVTFAREPHLACAATTDAQGVARCTMYDTHGHAPHEAGADPPPTVVTFAGRLGTRSVDVPVVALVETPRPTRCLTDVVPAGVATSWTPSCRGFASRTWSWPGQRAP